LKIHKKMDSHPTRIKAPKYGGFLIDLDRGVFYRHMKRKKNPTNPTEKTDIETNKFDIEKRPYKDNKIRNR
jgi:hypothetical protein